MFRGSVPHKCYYEQRKTCFRHDVRSPRAATTIEMQLLDTNRALAELQSRKRHLVTMKLSAEHEATLKNIRAEAQQTFSPNLPSPGLYPPLPYPHEMEQTGLRLDTPITEQNWQRYVQDYSYDQPPMGSIDSTEPTDQHQCDCNHPKLKTTPPQKRRNMRAQKELENEMIKLACSEFTRTTEKSPILPDRIEETIPQTKHNELPVPSRPSAELQCKFSTNTTVPLARDREQSVSTSPPVLQAEPSLCPQQGLLRTFTVPNSESCADEPALKEAGPTSSQFDSAKPSIDLLTESIHLYMISNNLTEEHRIFEKIANIFNLSDEIATKPAPEPLKCDAATQCELGTTVYESDSDSDEIEIVYSKLLQNPAAPMALEINSSRSLESSRSKSRELLEFFVQQSPQQKKGETASLDVSGAHLTPQITVGKNSAVNLTNNKPENPISPTTVSGLPLLHRGAVASALPVNTSLTDVEAARKATTILPDKSGISYPYEFGLNGARSGDFGTISFPSIRLHPLPLIRDPTLAIRKTPDFNSSSYVAPANPEDTVAAERTIHRIDRITDCVEVNQSEEETSCHRTNPVNRNQVMQKSKLKKGADSDLTKKKAKKASQVKVTKKKVEQEPSKSHGKEKDHNSQGYINIDRNKETTSTKSTEIEHIVGNFQDFEDISDDEAPSNLAPSFCWKSCNSVTQPSLQDPLVDGLIAGGQFRKALAVARADCRRRAQTQNRAPAGFPDGEINWTNEDTKERRRGLSFRKPRPNYREYDL